MPGAVQKRVGQGHGTWDVPAVFKWLQKAGNVAPTEMARVFNSGIGMVLVIPAEKVEEATSVLQTGGEKVAHIGVLSKRSGKECILTHLESWK
jgi:phosphoribosylaminoimidazole (AIR) synthetase